jgi:RES domain-containing protein
MAAAYTLEGDEVWHSVGAVTLYRLLPNDAPYNADGAWPGDGRFDVNGIPTLYLSRSPEGAVAEYLRRHPEFLAFQGRLKHRLFEVQFLGADHGADVRTEGQADKVGFPFDRLRSSDLLRADRFGECRVLATAVIDKPGHSIEYPSAAYEGVENVVALTNAGWTSSVEDELDLPIVQALLVRVLPSGAEP